MKKFLSLIAGDWRWHTAISGYSGASGADTIVATDSGGKLDAGFLSLPVSNKPTGAYTAVSADNKTYNRVDGDITLPVLPADDVGNALVFFNTGTSDITVSGVSGNVTPTGNSTISQHQVIIAKVVAADGTTTSYDLIGGTSA